MVSIAKKVIGKVLSVGKKVAKVVGQIGKKETKKRKMITLPTLLRREDQRDI